MKQNSMYNTKQMKAVIFCRVSSREQEETGYSLPAQEKLLREYSQTKGFSITKVFAISESAKKQNKRVSFKEMIKYLNKKKINILICEKTDRLTRNMKDAVMIKDWVEANENRQIHFLKENFVLSKSSKSNETFIWNIKTSVSQFYIDNLSEEVKKGQKEKIAQGWYPSRPPLGYKSAGESGHKIIVIDKNTAPFIERLFELYSTGKYSLLILEDKLKKEGFRNFNGKKVGKTTLHNILRNPFYYGSFLWNGKLYQGKHQPIISYKLFQLVQKKLKRPFAPQYNIHNYLFKSLIHCSECGGLITWEAHRGHIYGHCNHYRQCQQKKWHKEGKLEENLLINFKDLKIKNLRVMQWIRKALIETNKYEENYQNQNISLLKTQQQLLNKRMDTLYDDKADGKITEEFYKRKFNQYQNELQEITEKLKGENDENNLNNKLKVFDTAQSAKKLYKDLNPEGRKELIEFIHNDIKLSDISFKPYYSDSFKYLLKATKITNNSKVDFLPQKAILNFEQVNKGDISTKTAYFYTQHSALLGNLDSNQD